MLFGIPYAVLWFVAIFVCVVILSVVQNASRRRRADHDAREAALRGWQLKCGPLMKGGLLYTYSGRTDRVPWRLLTVQSLPVRIGQHRVQWEADEPNLENEVLAVFPSFGMKDPMTVAANTTSVLVQLASSARAIELRGRIDADHLARAQPVIPLNAGLEGYFFRATRPELMTGFLDSGAAAILASNSADLAPNARTGLVAFTVSPKGTTFVVSGRVSSLDRIAEVAKLGSALTTAAQKAIDPNWG